MPTTEKTDPMRAYLLRCWLEDTPSDVKPIWRFTLIKAGTNQRVGFSDLDQVVQWLSEQTDLKEIDR